MALAGSDVARALIAHCPLEFERVRNLVSDQPFESLISILTTEFFTFGVIVPENVIRVSGSPGTCVREKEDLGVAAITGGMSPNRSAPIMSKMVRLVIRQLSLTLLQKP